MARRRVVIVGGGTSGLAAAYALGRRGIEPVVLEAEDRVGGRMGGDRVDGFCIDQGADFLTPSHDVAIRLCNELGLRLVAAPMKLAWFRKGRFVTTSPGQSPKTHLRNLPALRTLGFLSPKALRATLQMVKTVRSKPQHYSFAGDSKIAELDGDENIIDHLKRLDAPPPMIESLQGFLEMTMGDLDQMGAAYALTYFGEIFLKSDEQRIPEQGIGSLTHALARAIGDSIHLSTPVRQVVIEDGTVTGVAVDDAMIEADAVICATSATVALGLMPRLPAPVRHALASVRYSRGCRVVIGLDHRPLPRGWHGVLYPEDETPLLLDRTINLPAAVPRGKSMLDLVVGRRRAEELFPLDDDEIKRELLRDARRNPPPGANLPGDNEGIFTRVYRWREAVCIAPPGMLEAVAEMRRRNDLDVENLFLAGDYMRMPSVNGALASGTDAAHEVAEFLASRSS